MTRYPKLIAYFDYFLGKILLQESEKTIQDRLF